MGRAEAIARDATPREWARRGARWVGPYLKLRRPAVAAVLLPGCATGYRSSGQRATASSRKLLLLEFCHWCLRRGRILSCICPLLRGRRHRRGGRVLAPVPHGGARSLQHVPWPATAPVSAFCPHPLARPGADARCATQRCFPRRSAGAAGARSGGENSPRFEDDDTVHTERHFVPGKSQGPRDREETADQTDPLRAAWRVPAADYSDSVVEARLRAGSGCRVPWSSRWHRSMPGQQLREHCEVDHGRSARGVRWFSWMCASPPCASVLVDTRSNSNSESRWPDCRGPNQAQICPAEGTLGRVRCRE